MEGSSRVQPQNSRDPRATAAARFLPPSFSPPSVYEQHPSVFLPPFLPPTLILKAPQKQTSLSDALSPCSLIPDRFSSFLSPRSKEMSLFSTLKTETNPQRRANRSLAVGASNKPSQKAKSTNHKLIISLI